MWYLKISGPINIFTVTYLLQLIKICKISSHFIFSAIPTVTLNASLLLHGH
jgi:hypothetical protein